MNQVVCSRRCRPFVCEWQVLRSPCPLLIHATKRMAPAWTPGVLPTERRFFTTRTPGAAASQQNQRCKARASRRNDLEVVSNGWKLTGEWPEMRIQPAQVCVLNVSARPRVGHMNDQI